jgi:uncharacterized membrane protein YdbT with pleckstrin-like domain
MSRTIERSSEFIYRGLWKVLADWFRVPREPPDLPVRPGEYIARFQPGEGWLRYLKAIFWIVLAITDIPLTIAWIAGSIALIAVGLWWVALLIALPAILLIVGPDILAYVVIHLKYDTTWYVMTDRSLRIRRGVWSIRETTITFENVQNVKVRQGPVQRYFGIANLIVETAGGGGGAGGGGKHGGGTDMHTGVIEGIANAQELRDRILAKLRASKTAGLGDEDHAHEHEHRVDAHASHELSPAHVEALRAIRDELRQMRAA